LSERADESVAESVTQSVSVRLLGSNFVATSGSTAAINHIRRLWHPFIMDDGGVDDGGVDDGGVDDGELVALDNGSDISDSKRLATFAVAVNASALDRAPDFAVHCAVVACGQTAVAMPATSGVGKSTLTAACLRVGFSYVSDEALCLRQPDGRVVPYPRPIALSPWSAHAVEAPTPGVEAGEELLFTAVDLGSRVAADKLRVRHIVLLDRHPAGPPAIREAARPAAITRLLELSFNHYRRPAGAVQLAAAVVADAAVWTLGYSEPLAAARLLWSAFGGAEPVA
jgi:hypothetical protein